MTTISSGGYVLVYVGKDHPMADVRGYAYEHRLIAAQKAGRMLSSKEIAHHDDEIKSNNAEENIIPVSSIAAHRALHRKKGSKLRLPDEPNPDIICACGCGQSLKKYDDLGRPRKYLDHHSHRKGTGRRNSKEQVICGCGCGEAMNRYDGCGRERKYITGHNMRRINK